MKTNNTLTRAARDRVLTDRIFDDSSDKCSPVRITQVVEHEGELTAASERLAKAVSNLIERLNPVLRIECPAPVCAQGDHCNPPDAPLAPLAEKLRNHSRCLHNLASMVEDAVARVEV